MNPSLIPVVDVIAKGIAVLLLAMGILNLWRGASASQRSLVWLLCFGTLMLLPVIMLIQPRWPVPVSETPTVVQLPATPIPVVAATAVAGDGISSAAVTTEQSITSRWTLLQMGVAVWGIGITMVLGWRFMGSIRLRLLSSLTQRCDDVRVRSVFTQVAEEARLRRAVKLRMSEQVSVPMTWGSLGPVVLLPTEATTWSTEDLRAAMRHEMGHIKHWDHLARLLMSVVCAVYWFNPLVWLCAKRWRTAQEQASDDLVVAREDHRAESYAMQLLNAARRTQREGLLRLPVMTMAQPSTLELRLSAIMDERTNRASVRRASVWMGTVGALSLLMLCASLQLHAAEPPKAAQQVSITCRIFECATDAGKQKVAALKIDNNKPPQLAPEASETFIKELSAIDGVTLLSAPRVITASGNNAVIKLETNNIYGVEKTGAKSGTVVSGLLLELLPTVSDGNISLQITPTIKDFEGVEMKDGVNQPVMKERKLEAKVTIEPGETVALDGGVAKIAKAQRQLIFLITADLGAHAVTASGAPATGRARVQMVNERDPSFVPAPPPPKPAALQRAESIIIPSVQFKEATLKEAVEFFRVKSRAADPSGKGVSIVLTVDAAKSKALLTLNLKSVPLSEALRYTAALSELELTADEVSLTLKKPAPSAPASTPAAAPTQPAVPPAKSAALEKAERIILPSVKFSSASAAEAVEFFRIKAQQVDPEKKGVNILLSGGAPPKVGQFSLDLKDVPLSEALRYTAELLEMDFVAEEHALYLRTRPAQK